MSQFYDYITNLISVQWWWWWGLNLRHEVNYWNFLPLGGHWWDSNKDTDDIYRLDYKKMLKKNMSIFYLYQQWLNYPIQPEDSQV